MEGKTRTGPIVHIKILINFMSTRPYMILDIKTQFIRSYVHLNKIQDLVFIVELYMEELFTSIVLTYHLFFERKSF